MKFTVINTLCLIKWWNAELQSEQAIWVLCWMTEITNSVQSYGKYYLLNVDPVEKLVLSKTIIQVKTIVQGLKISLGKN